MLITNPSLNFSINCKEYHPVSFANQAVFNFLWTYLASPGL